MGKRKPLLESIEDESTLFLTKTPEELLKELQTHNSVKSKPKNILMNNSKMLEKQIQNLITEATSEEEDNSNSKVEAPGGEEEDYSEIDNEEDSELLNLNPMEQLKMLENPVEGEYDDEEAYDQDENFEDEYTRSNEVEEDDDLDSQSIGIKQSKDPKRKLLLSDDDMDSDEAELNKAVSSYQRERQKIISQAHQIEEENVKEANWTLKGEISSKARPENSLLEEDLEFDFQSVPPPVITETISESIEDIIKRRILERAFDNPEIPITQEMKDDATLFKQRRQKIKLEMQERADLGKIHEQDFLRAKGELADDHTLDPKLKAKYKELRELYDKVSHTMDSLLYKSNHFLIRY